MINLLPPESKKTIDYARKNTLLLRGCLGVVAVIVGVLVVLGMGHFYLSTSTSRYEKDAASLKLSLQEQDIDEVKAEIQDLSSSVKLALQVLSREILFSKLLRQAGAVMPNGSSLSSLEICSDQKGVDISAGVNNYEIGTQVQLNLSDPNNKLFKQVDLISVQCNTAGGQYPCTAQLRALLADNSPYLFINNQQGDN